MPRKTVNISLALGWNERYDHKVAIGIIKASRDFPDWRLFGNEWLFQNESPAHGRVDGIIARITTRDDLRRLLGYRVPVVDIANAFHHTRLPRVMNDDFLTGRLIADHLLEKGFPRLAYVGIDETSWSNERRLGVLAALEERDGPELSHFSVGTAWLGRQHSLTGLARWLGKLALPCGIVAANDLLGYRVTIAAAMAGLAIPEQLGVVGVDNEDVYCQLSQPTLTSIACNCERIGREAATLLRQILNGEDPLLHVVVPPQGIDQRASTNIIVGEDPLVRDVKNFIAKHVEHGINVADVVQAFPLSRRALEKRFRETADTTIHDEITRVRLDRARALLLAGTNANATALKSGFRTVKHFYHAFTKHFGLPPMALVRKHRQENPPH